MSPNWQSIAGNQHIHSKYVLSLDKQSKKLLLPWATLHLSEQKNVCIAGYKLETFLAWLPATAVQKNETVSSATSFESY